MATTQAQLMDLGFKPAKKESPYKKKYDTLVCPLNKTDYLYLGYNSLTREINNKIIWKSFLDETGERITYPALKLGETSFTGLKEYIENSKAVHNPEVSL